MGGASKYVRTICEIGIFAAIGFVLDELQGIIFKGVFINGGSIGFAMIAVLIVGYRRGWLPGLLTGLIMGLFDIATSAYIIHPAQLFLDYILPYALVAVGCLCKYPFNKAHTKGEHILWLILGTVVGGVAKFISHYLAGVIFWADQSNFVWGLTWMNPYSYCLVYNIAYIAPSVVLTAAILIALYLRAPMVLTVKSKKKRKSTKASEEEVEEEEEEKKPLSPTPYVATLGLAALGCFIYFLIIYIKSFNLEIERDESNAITAIDYNFDPNSMAVVVLNLFLIILTIISLVKISNKKFNIVIHSEITLIIMGLSLIYGIVRLATVYDNNSKHPFGDPKYIPPMIYWIWFGVGLLTVAIFLALTIVLFNRRRKLLKLEKNRRRESNESSLWA